MIFRERIEGGRQDEWLISIRNFIGHENMNRDRMIGLDFWVLLGCMMIFNRIRRLLF